MEVEPRLPFVSSTLLVAEEQATNATQATTKASAKPFIEILSFPLRLPKLKHGLKSESSVKTKRMKPSSQEGFILDTGFARKYRKSFGCALLCDLCVLCVKDSREKYLNAEDAETQRSQRLSSVKVQLRASLCWSSRSQLICSWNSARYHIETKHSTDLETVLSTQWIAAASLSYTSR